MKIRRTIAGNGQIEQLLRHVLLPTDLDGCWKWVHPVKKHRVPMMKFGKVQAAARFVWTLYKGEVPPGLVIVRGCLNRLCVNPDHLQALSPGEATRLVSQKMKGASRALDEAQRALAVDLRQSGMKYRDIAQRVPASAGTVRLLCLKLGISTPRFLKEAA